jgi:hypothetical protein
VCFIAHDFPDGHRLTSGTLAASTIALRASCYCLLGRFFVVLPLLRLFLFRQLLLLVFFFVLLATPVSHGSSFLTIMTALANNGAIQETQTSQPHKTFWLSAEHDAAAAGHSYVLPRSARVAE